MFARRQDSALQFEEQNISGQEGVSVSLKLRVSLKMVVERRVRELCDRLWNALTEGMNWYVIGEFRQR